ncbi:Transposase IS4 [Popillia japonica]|uniref:Transposase IS4 n=1 Tax=Popillia japonica TaxID=7064 RepID=A0AAW1K0C3_POPJA
METDSDYEPSEEDELEQSGSSSSEDELSDNLLQFFNLFFDDELVNEIALQTNIYAGQVRTEGNAKSQWRDVTSNEIRLFLAINIMQSVVKKPDLQDYWSRNPIIETPFVRKMMPYKRFVTIKQYLHFSDNAKQAVNLICVRYEEKIEKRLYELKSLQQRQKEVCKSLGCEPIPIQESLPTVEEIDKLCAHIEGLENEKFKREQLKKAYIGKFIKTMLEELLQYWDKCHFSSAERESFETYYQANKETLLMLERREEYLKRLTELEDRENDLNHYKNRGGTVLKEEKERNGLKKKLREMELVLLDIAVKFEEEHNRPFLSWGRSIPDIIEKTREDYETNKKQSGFLGSTLSGSKRNLLTLTSAPSAAGTSSKQKLPPTSLFSSNKKRTPMRATPIIRLNDQTLTQKTKLKDRVQKRRLRYSHERKKRMDKIRRLSKVLMERRNSNEFLDIDEFELIFKYIGGRIVVFYLSGIMEVAC